jgi:hypothetical protein
MAWRGPCITSTPRAGSRPEPTFPQAGNSSLTSIKIFDASGNLIGSVDLHSK